MKSRLLGIAAALAVLVLLAPEDAPADTIEVTFTGLAGGIRPTFINNVYNLGSFSNKPFTADFVFDTALGSLQTVSPGSYRLDGGLVSAFMDLGDFGIWGGNGGSPLSAYFYQSSPSFLTWQDDLSSVVANAFGLGGYHHLAVSNTPPYGSFQFGLCPGIGLPCGTITSISSLAVVPLPVVGSGLPALVLAGLFAWWRRRQKIA